LAEFLQPLTWFGRRRLFPAAGRLILLKMPATFERFSAPSGFSMTPGKLLRLRRVHGLAEGSRFRAYVKQDVGEWRVLGDKIWQVPQALLVGVMARNTASKPFMPSFSEFDLTVDNVGLK
jgi:hypothetical protein